MNRGPIILNIDEAECILDLLAEPSSDEDEIKTKLRMRFQELLKSLRENAEGANAST